MVWDDSVDSSCHWAVFCGSGPHSPTPSGTPQSPYSSPCPWHLTEQGHLPFPVGGQDPPENADFAGLVPETPSPCGGPGPQRVLREDRQPTCTGFWFCLVRPGRARPRDGHGDGSRARRELCRLCLRPQSHTGSQRPGTREALPAPISRSHLKTNGLASPAVTAGAQRLLPELGNSSAGFKRFPHDQFRC